MTKLSVITGAAGGMGSAIARLLGRTQRLILTDVDEAGLDKLLSALSSEGLQAEGLAGDLDDPALSATLAERCAQAGTIRSVVNAAGLSPAQADWQSIVRANSIGPVRLLDALEPLLAADAACVMIASVAGHLGPRNSMIESLLDDPLQPGLFDALRPGLATLVDSLGGKMESHAYSFTKRAIIRLCEQRAPAWGARGARIISLSPGVVGTSMGLMEAASGDRAQAMIDATPAGRWGRADDIAAATEFLLSDAAGYITGCDLRVDGGAVAAMRGRNF